MQDIKNINEFSCVSIPGTIEEIDEVGYLLANPSIEKMGMSAKEYFSLKGKNENRAQWTNLSLVADLRKQKLANVRLLDGLSINTLPYNAISSLTKADIENFGIPEDVPISAHPYGPPMLKLVRENRDKLFLDLGAGLRHTYHSNVINTDIFPFVCSDVICVGESLPFEDGQFDYVFCFAVLEHTLRPWDVAKEISRILKVGGVAFIDWPFLQPVHGYPHHYYNATPKGNASLFEPYCDIQSVEVGWHHHPVISAQWMLGAWAKGLPSEISQKFQSLTISEIINQPVEDLLKENWCTDLRKETKQVIPAGSLLTAIKR